MTDTRFSSAIHTLIMIAGSEAPLTSEEIAKSVGTNSSYIRKLTALLRKGEIIKGRPGVGGFSLCVPPEKLTLYMIYNAIFETEHIHVFDLHQNANDKCIVGEHIKPVLSTAFYSIEQKAEEELKKQTLSDLMDKMRKEISKGAKK
ncbi:MAG: Rrf2 family transcriptional regulator [Clostridia bacterium]|nr:Rrf2 family transcriptional regulator [Clostridia bacterium]